VFDLSFDAVQVRFRARVQGATTDGGGGFEAGDYLIVGRAFGTAKRLMQKRCTSSKFKETRRPTFPKKPDESDLRFKARGTNHAD
jgi:hypothetical protein